MRVVSHLGEFNLGPPPLELDLVVDRVTSEL